MPDQKRQLAAIMFTDIVGYTTLMGKDSNKALELVQQSKQIQKPLVKKHNGKWLKEMGDGAMAQFGSALDAVNCAVEIQKLTNVTFEGRLRIGIHLGDITIENDDVYGDGVNVASRLESIADPGGIYVSDAILKAIKGQTNIQTRYLGEVQLKNVDYLVRTYALQGDGLTGITKHRIKQLSTTAIKKPIFRSIWLYLVLIAFLVIAFWWRFLNHDTIDEFRVRSLAVLPFENLTGDPAQDYFVSGIHDNLITKLSQISSLDIISRTSTLKYNDTDKSTPEIAKELGVDAVIEASVLRSTDSIRINVQLIQALPNEKHLWANIFDRPIGNILYLLDEVTQSIAMEIDVALKKGISSTLSAPRKLDPEAYKAYLNGLFHSEKGTAENLEAALNYFEQSIEMDSTFAPPYAMISFVWIVKWQIRLAPLAEALPNIYKYNQKALELDENYPESQYISALMSVQIEWDWEKSENSFKRAIEVNPNHALAHAFYGHLLIILKRFDEAVIEMEQAIKLDPNSSFILGLYAIVLWHKGDLEKAIVISDRSRELDPRNGNDIVRHSISYMKGNYEQSFSILEGQFSKDTISFKGVKKAYLENGYEAAMKVLAQNLEQNPLASAVGISVFCNRAGMYDEAIRILEKGYERHDPDMSYAFLPIEMNNLRSDPRYAELAKKMNLPF